MLSTSPHASPRVGSMLTLPSGRRIQYVEYGDASGTPVLYLHGAPGFGKRGAAEALCGAAGRAALMVDVPAVIAGGRAGVDFGRAAREALLQDAVLTLDGFDVLLKGEVQTIDLGGGATWRYAYFDEPDGTYVCLTEARY